MFGNIMGCGCCGPPLCAVNVALPRVCVGGGGQAQVAKITLHLTNLDTGIALPVRTNWSGGVDTVAILYSSLPSGNYRLVADFTDASSVSGLTSFYDTQFEGAVVFQTPKTVDFALDCTTTGTLGVPVTTTPLHYIEFYIVTAVNSSGIPVYGTLGYGDLGFPEGIRTHASSSLGTVFEIRLATDAPPLSFTREMTFSYRYNYSFDFSTYDEWIGEVDVPMDYCDRTDPHVRPTITLVIS